MMVPSVEFPQAVPFTSQVTTVLVEMGAEVLEFTSFARFTVAVKSAWAPGATVAEDGVMLTELTVTAPEPPQPDMATETTKIISSGKMARRYAFLTALNEGNSHPALLLDTAPRCS
jgi:hypothetical protein